jgi:hypothetical protein
MHRELVRPDDRRPASPRPAAAIADPRLALASKLGNRAFTRYATLQRLLAVAESSIEERDLDSYLMVYPSKVKPLIQQKVPMPLRGQVHDKLQSWASAPGVMPWKFKTYEDAVLAALADVQGVPQLPPHNPGPTATVPDDSDVLFGKETTEKKKRQQPSKEEQQQEVKLLLAQLEKEFMTLLAAASKRLLTVAEFDCTDWADFDSQCTSYLAAMSLELQQVVAELIKAQSALVMCNGKLCHLFGATDKAEVLKGTAQHARKRVVELIPLCVIQLDGEVQSQCVHFVAGYLNLKSSELTESVKTAQKKPRSSDLARVRWLMYSDLYKQIFQLAKMMPSVELRDLLLEWAKLLQRMAKTAKTQADQKSELHAGRNQGSHF